MKRQSGFTIIEIIIVVIILGLLAATALPRFLAITDDAEDASIDGIAGGFASAVGLVRGQWEVEGRPAGNFTGAGSNVNMSFVTVDNTQIGVNATGTPLAAGESFGFPTMTPVDGGNSQDNAMTDAKCREVLNLILQNAPRSIAQTAATDVTLTQIAGNTLFVQANTPATATICYYYQTNGLAAVPARTDISSFNGFSYTPSNGTVSVFKNKPN